MKETGPDTGRSMTMTTRVARFTQRDGITKSDYTEGVDGPIEELSARIGRLGYQPKAVRRVYIPKGEGRNRPLGVPCFEDRLLQDRMSRSLQAIWEPEFRDGS